jgi:hypothetical protein
LAPFVIFDLAYISKFISPVSIENRLMKAPLLTQKTKFDWGMGVGALGLVLLLLLSQYVGWVHNLTHAPPPQWRQQMSSAPQTWSMASLADAHFGQDSYSSNDSESINVSCKLFDALMLGVCIASWAIVIELMQFGFKSQKVSHEGFHNPFRLWTYLSRAPPASFFVF